LIRFQKVIWNKQARNLTEMQVFYHLEMNMTAKKSKSAIFSQPRFCMRELGKIAFSRCKSFNRGKFRGDLRASIMKKDIEIF